MVTAMTLEDQLKLLEEKVWNCEQKEDFTSARSFQIEIVRLRESDSKCTSGALGESYFRLAKYSLAVGNDGVLNELSKALGLLRIYFGKDSERVKETMALVREIRKKEELANPKKFRRRTPKPKV